MSKHVLATHSINPHIVMLMLYNSRKIHNYEKTAITH